MTREIIGAPARGLDFKSLYGYQQSLGVRANGLIFISGLVAVDPETGERLHGSVTTEAHRIFQNLKLILDSAGSSLALVVQVHAFIYDRIEYDVLNRVYEKYLTHLPPARTVWSVQIESGFKVQLDAIAVAE